MSIKYTYYEYGDSANVTVVHSDGEVYTASNEHPAFSEIVEKARAGDDSVVDLFDAGRKASGLFKKITDRVSIRNGQVYFDNEPTHDVLSRQVADFVGSGLDFTPLVNFYEKIQTNPNKHSREQLFGWLQANGGFTITEDGDIIGYKGVVRQGDDLVSVHSGYAIVDGKEVNGKVPNNPGSVVEMPRSDVQHDPSIGCHTGLHVGTYEYAKSFGSVLLSVLVNPRDVVSVPTDCSEQKMRTCRYRVAEVIEEKVQEPLHHVNYEDEDYDDDDDFAFRPSSSFIEEVQWDGEAVTVYFTSGPSAYYYNVPRDVYDEWANAESAGRFYNEHILNNPDYS